jgi:hypothetical protein
MNESGVDLGFDFAELSSEDLDLCSDLLNQEEALAVSSSQNDFMFYELKSKTVPERLVFLRHCCCSAYTLRMIILRLHYIYILVYLCIKYMRIAAY